MKSLQIAALITMAALYAAFFGKIILQRKKGLHTDQIGKGKKPKKVLAIERLMKLAAYLIVPVEIMFILLDIRPCRPAARWTGIGIAAVGVGVFIAAMSTMRDSWRAGIPAEDKTMLVTTGLYRISRNPAFLGFDLMYIGLLVAFFHYIHLLFVIFALVMLHLQILQEEKFLAVTFGEDYDHYKKQVGRYLFF